MRLSIRRGERGLARWSRPAASRSPRWAPPASAISWPSSSASRPPRPRPALVPLTFEPRILERMAPLAGIAVDATVTAQRQELPRGAAVHPSGPQRAGDPPDLELLARRRRDRRRPAARQRRAGRARRQRAVRRRSWRLQTVLARASAQAAGADAGRGDRRPPA